MNLDEVTAKLREYEEAGGDDAVLPAVLRVLLESNQQHADALAKSQKAMDEKCAAIQKEQKAHADAFLESRQQNTDALAKSQKAVDKQFATIQKEWEAHAKASSGSHRKLSDELTKLQKSMTERFTAIQNAQKAHAETVQTRVQNATIALALVVIGAAAVLALVLLS